MKLHAPSYWDHDEPLCDRLPENFELAAPGQTINCYLCKLALRKQPQWLNQLLSMGYKVQTARRHRRKGSKKDPRQLGFGDTE